MKTVCCLFQDINTAALYKQFLLLFFDLSGNIIESARLQYLQGLEYLHLHIAPYIMADLFPISFQLRN